METLGRYRIVRELGRGAMGRVYLAHDPEIDREIAIKTIQVFEGLPEGEREEARARFVREARAAGKLLHPSIVTIFDAGDAQGVPYLAMEYVRGTTLDHHARPDDRLPVESVVELVAHAAEALDFAHRAGIIHRDVKPANLMRVGERAVKIMDFGLARTAAVHLTQDGALLGTPSYMSPEQVRGAPLDGRSDLFSLAVVLFELLTGVKPFAGDSVSSVLFRIVHEEPADLTPHLDRIPAPLAGFLRKALAKDPDLRFPDGAAFARELRRVAARPPSDGTGIERLDAGTGSVPPREDPRPRGARRVFLATTGAVVLVGGAVAAWFYFEGPPAPPPPPEWTARVRTEPPGLPVRVDGRILEGPEIRFRGAAPFPTLVVKAGCREVTRTLGPEDAGGEIVLVPDPTETTVVVEAEAPGAKVFLNGEAVGVPGESIRLDLCRENRLEVRVEGYRTAAVTVPAGEIPLNARTAAAGLRLEALPTGRVALPDPGYPLRWSVDGKALPVRTARVDLPEGTHRLRAWSEAAFVDVEGQVEVPGGETVTPGLALPKLGRLLVQAFPANAKIYARRGADSSWTFLDEAPLDRNLAAGRYRVRVEFLPSGKVVEKDVEVRAGDNPPVRAGIAEAQ